MRMQGKSTCRTRPRAYNGQVNSVRVEPYPLFGLWFVARFYACNRYEDGRQRGEYDAEQKRRDMAKASHERYMHYYERWA
eukprot:752298-Pyramimonas_sp.AAC.2